MKVVDGPRVLDTGVYESEKWGGGRLIRSGLKVTRLKDEGVDLNSSKLSSCRVSDKSPVSAVHVHENTVAKRTQPAETHKLAPPRTSGPATTPSLPPKLTNVPPAATKSPAKYGTLRFRRRPGAMGQWKGYVLAEDCPPRSKGKLLLLDAPPALLPERSTRSGKVFKRSTSGSSSEQSGCDDSEEERKVNRSRRSRQVARKHVLLSEDSDE